MNTRVNKLEPGKIIPLNFDYVFNNIFNNENNIDILENFLAIYFDKPLDDIKGHITLKKRELPSSNKYEMDNQVDILLNMDCKIINIELNNNSSKKILERNIVYASKIHGKQLKHQDNDYSKIGYTHQINLNNFRCNEIDIKEKYFLKNESGKILSEKLEIDLIDIELAKDKSYNKYNEKLTKLLRVLVTVDKDELVKELSGVMERDALKKLIDQVDEYSSDSEVIKLYSDYTKAELEKNTLINDAREEGIKEEKRNVIKNMLIENIDMDIISKVTGLNIDQINKIKNSL